MARPAWLERSVSRLAETSGQQLGLQAGMVVFALVAVNALGSAARVMPVALLVGLLAFAVLAVALPDTALVLVFMVVLVWAWLILVRDHATGWAPVAAVGLLGLHACAALSTSAPVGARFDALTWRRWVTRTVVVALVAVAVWLGTVLVAGYRLPGDVLLTTLAVLLLGLVALGIRYVGLRRTAH